MNSSIVCGVESSQESRSAARVAAALARELGHELVLVHVADDPSTFPYRSSRLRELQHCNVIQDATAMLERVAATLSGIVPETRVLLGDPVEALTTVSREDEPALMIVASRGRGRLSAAVLGSVSTRLASVAECPVVVVPSVQAADRFLARAPGSQLVCGLDDSIGSLRALRLAAGLADRMRLELLPVHIDPNATWQDAPLGTPAPLLKVYSGDPVEELRERVVDANATALVVGSRGRGAWRAAALGSVSGALAASAPVPVIVVPPSAQLTRLAENVDATVADVLHRARHWTAHRTREGLSTPIRRTAVDHRHVGRFSEGVEQLPETLSKLREGRFSEGSRHLPVTRRKLRRRRFSEGIEQLPASAATRRRGSFADGYGDTAARRRNAV